MAVKTYSPLDMVILVAGQQVTGFSDTDMLAIALDEPKFVKYTGVGGDSSRSHNVANGATITFQLSQTSSANDLFSTILLADTKNPTGNNVVNVEVRDPNSGTKFLAIDSWIQGMPEVSYAKEISVREWVFDVPELTYTIKGSQGDSNFQ